jgi:hypothetical protein
MPDKALHRNSGRLPDRQFARSAKEKKGSGDCELHVMVSERRFRINTVLIIEHRLG